MKSQENVLQQHHSPSLRKSPRFASASTQLLSKPEENADASWSLSLHVAEPQPLKICHPFDDDEIDHRRPSRFTINKYRTPSPECNRRSKPKALPALLAPPLRRSPRLSSPPPAPALTLRSGKVLSPREVGSQKRRRSEDKTSIIMKKGKLNLDRMSLRKSLRLNWGDFGNSSSVILALPEPESPPLKQVSPSQRCLRSRTALLHVGNEKAKVERINSGNFSEDEKCLRSRIVKSALVKSPEALEKRLVRSASSKLPSVQRSDSGERSLRSRLMKCALAKSSEASDKRATRSASRDRPSVLQISGSQEKCLRSRSVKMLVGDSKSSDGNSCVGSDVRFLRSPTPKIDSDDPSEFKIELGQCDSEMRSEKSLRSRKIQFKLIVDGSPEKKTIRTGGSASKKEESGDRTIKSEKNEKKHERSECSFIGDPIPEEEARERWGWRYELKRKRKCKSGKLNAGGEDEIILNVDRHYAHVKLGTCVLDIGDCAHVKGEGKHKHIGRILEFFRTTEGEDYFRVQWFFRAEDTVLKDAASSHDKRRIFYSTLKNDNMLDCLISKVNVMKIPPALCGIPDTIKSAAYYYDMEYSVDYSTFRTLFTETCTERPDLFSMDPKSPDDLITPTTLEVLPNSESPKSELALLDLFSGCGGMSTGLCFGAKVSNINLVTKWAVDYDSSACESLKLNHPETQVRNESAEDFLELLKKWEELCKLHMCSLERTLKCELEDLCEVEDWIVESDKEASSAEYEVGYLVDICYGDPNDTGKRQLHFKVRWKGYGPDEDTWESLEGLSKCQERIQDFVRRGYRSKILPLPGDVDVICGGPPCQGISGYNRYRNFESPLTDERNHQIVVFMDIVEFLKPKYILMENVVDIIRFDRASLARYALSRLVRMKYQARLGTMASGCYGLPQFRLRVFIWGADPNEILPQFPLPTHDVVVRYWPPLEFERNIVAYDEGQLRELEEAIILRDSISDLPAVSNKEDREEMAYEKPPETEFQRYIRLSRNEIMGAWSTPPSQTRHSILYDHRPLKLTENDYLRVSQIPHRKGANFRDLQGVIVGQDNVARLDPTKEPIMLPNGAPLVPDSVFSYDQGKSKRPYSRLWWDETVSTVLTYPHVRVQAILHPEQDRLLTIRECARLQGFPDFYRFCGTTKERYRQVGNAVSIPVARALGYALGMSYKKLSGEEPLMTLPPKFSSILPPSGHENGSLKKDTQTHL